MIVRVALALVAATMSISAVAAESVELYVAGSLRSAAGRSGPVWMFARIRPRALVRPGLAVETATLLERMLMSDVKLGTSTPRADHPVERRTEYIGQTRLRAAGCVEMRDTPSCMSTGAR
jgi:hypothetical protein